MTLVAIFSLSVGSDTPTGLSRIFSLTMPSVSLSSFLHGPFNVATTAKLQSHSQILTPSNCVLSVA